MSATSRGTALDRRVGKRLRACRKERGLRQADVAARLEIAGKPVSHATVSNWERGEYSLTVSAIVALADAFGMSVPTLSARLGLCGEQNEAAGRTLEFQDLIQQAANLPPDRIDTLLGFVRTSLLLLESGDPNRTN